MLNIPICKVEFKGLLSQFETIPELGAYTIADLFRGIANYYDNFERCIWEFNADKFFVITINNEFYVEDVNKLNVLLPYRKNEVTIQALTVLEGKAASIALGVGLLAVAVFTGVGITTFGLLGLSLIFSAIYKPPKTNINDKTDKRSVNFSGTINTTGGGQCLPLVFGEAWTGSIVASAYISPQRRSIN